MDVGALVDMCVVVVVRALGVLGVLQPMGVHAAIGHLRVVLENDLHSVTDLGSNEGTQNSQVLPLRGAQLQSLECGVRILAIDRFQILFVRWRPALEVFLTHRDPR